ncbi:hypothetical protein BGZ80_007860, partial [Entomortierella chlamydospora]
MLKDVTLHVVNITSTISSSTLSHSPATWLTNVPYNITPNENNTNIPGNITIRDTTANENDTNIPGDTILSEKGISLRDSLLRAIKSQHEDVCMGVEEFCRVGTIRGLKRHASFMESSVADDRTHRASERELKVLNPGRVRKYAQIQPLHQRKRTPRHLDHNPILPSLDLAPVLHSIGRKDFKDAPQFFMEQPDTTRSQRARYVVKTVAQFLQSFGRFYKEALTAVFEELSCRYMHQALKYRCYQTRLSTMMAEPARNRRNWVSVKACIKDMFRMDSLQADIMRAFYNLKPTQNQSVFEYVEQIRILVEGSGLGKALLDRYKGIKKIPSIDHLLQFLCRTPMTLTSVTTDTLDWLKTTFLQGYTSGISTTAIKLIAASSLTATETDPPVGQFARARRNLDSRVWTKRLTKIETTETAAQASTASSV